MKKTLTKIGPVIFAAVVLLSLASVAQPQTSSCDGSAVRRCVGFSGLSGDITWRFNQYCTSPAGDTYCYTDNALTATCKGCMPATVNHGIGWEHGGTSQCSNFEKRLVIEYEKPVADVAWMIIGAKTVTDNRGYTAHLDPPRDANGYPQGVLVKFPGNGITSITVSDPIEYPVYYWDGSMFDPACWKIEVGNGDLVPESVYNQCNCNRPVIASPPAQTVQSHWLGANWSMQAEVTENDGLVLRNIKLNNRLMAEKISVPYYTLETSAFPKGRGELKPNSNDTPMRSRLVSYYVNEDGTKLVVEAIYVVDRIPATSESCLHITQRYEFYNRVTGDQCEPSGSLPCSRWKPIVKYRFLGRGGDVLKSINIPQRLHLTIDNNPYTTAGLFRDNDYLSEVLSDLDGFAKRANPLYVETTDRIITGGKPVKQWDNIHLTYKGVIEEPYLAFDLNKFFHIEPGCPECVHSHWRWGIISGGEGGGNLVGIAPESTQDVDVAVVRNESYEDDPTDYKELVHSWQWIRTFSTFDRNPLQIYRNFAPEDIVYWQSATGYQDSDTFFGYGSFFNPSLPSTQLYDGLAAPTAPTQGGSLASSSQSLTETTQDGLTSITAAHIYVEGPITIEPFDPTIPGPLPPGYTPYNNLSYDIKTEAESSGPYTLTFNVPSVSDQTVFDNLRVFHLEQDQYDPAQVVWVDRTVLPPDSQAPDFANKTLSAKANALGQYVVGSLTQPQPPNTAAADIAISSSDSPDPVVAGSNLTYTLNVTNNGPQTATGVVFSDALSPGVKFSTATGSQGNCVEVDSTVVCKLGTIAAGASATVTITVKPIEGETRLPPEGKTITSTAFAKAQEVDSNQANNTAIENSTVLPDPNKAPTVKITSPTSGVLLVGPVSIPINATASDSDGNINKVDFYADGNLVGTGIVAGSNQYNIVWNDAPFGNHSLVAVATDNLGKIKVSEAVNVIVNGGAAVSITSPANWSVFNRPANITITANASYSSGSISKTEFYADGFLMGVGTVTGADQYSFTWSSAPAGRHSLKVVATDNSGVATTSSPVNITVNDPPYVGLISPANGTNVAAPVTLTANASDGDGGISKVDFYANGALIGSSSTIGANLFNFVWNNPAFGSYSLTAVATDNYGATTSSSPVSITISNAAPTVSMASPANGAQYTAPASVIVKATASDTDGSISKVDFFANEYRIGTGTAPAGSNQYSFTWANVGRGSYTLKAVATDNSGATKTSGVVNITVSSPALLVTGSTTLNSSDSAVKSRLEAMKYVVTVKDGASATGTDANGKALVVISSTVTPTSVGTKFRTVTVPVVLWESSLYYDMGMTAKTSSNFGTTASQTQLTITNQSHPLAGGLSGTITTITAPTTLSWGKPNTSAASVATQVGDATRAAIFGYESGAAMPGLAAPARRVGLFMHDNTAASFNNNGWTLFDAAIKWAGGTASLSGSKTATPTGAPLNLTAEGFIDWAHWGFGGPAIFNHQNGITQQISNFSLIGTTSPTWFADCPTTFSWTNGTPTLNVSGTTTGISVGGQAGNGLEITIPADTNLKTLKLYVGVWYTQGKLEAILSDGSAPAFVDTSMNNNAGASSALYTIQYKAATPGQTLKVRYTILNTYFLPYGNVAMEAATLR